ncbi:MAG: fibronectin type III domain-containing protein [Chloroflexota bacterium]
MRLTRLLGRLIRVGAVLAVIVAVATPMAEPAAQANPQAGAAVAVPPVRQSTADARFFPQTGFYVDRGPMFEFFAARGGARVFGPPVSNRFRLSGNDVQVFSNHVMRMRPDGNPETIELLGTEGLPTLKIDGHVLPPVEPALTASMPRPGPPDYYTAAQAFVAANAPDQWDGLPVGFLTAFLTTVSAQDAFPGAVGDVSLLPRMAVDVWGMPVSKPTRDLLDSNLIYLRFERGVMQYDRRTNRVTAVPLGQYFKAILTGENLPPDLAGDAQRSRFFRQVDRSQPGGVARPADIPDSWLVDAFQPSQPATVAAAPTVTQSAAAASNAQPVVAAQAPLSQQAAAPATSGQASTSTQSGQPVVGSSGLLVVPSAAQAPDAAVPTSTPAASAVVVVAAGGPLGSASFPQAAFTTPTPETVVVTVPAAATAPPAPTTPPPPPPAPPTIVVAQVVPPAASPAPVTTTLSGSQIGGATAPAPVVNSAASDPCWGDELITYVPENPRVGQELLIAVTSAKPHPYGRLVGTEKTTFVRERPGQLGLVWEWSVTMTFPGNQDYTFYVDSTIPCKRTTFKVDGALGTPTAIPAPPAPPVAAIPPAPVSAIATSTLVPTATPTKTPKTTRGNSNSNNSNKNGSKNKNKNSNHNNKNSNHNNGNNNDNIVYVASIIVQPTVTTINQNTVQITWQTDRLSDSEVEYATNADDIGTNSDQQKLEKADVTFHTVTITNLIPGVTYFYRVSSAEKDNRDRIGYTGTLTFVTIAPTPTATQTLVPSGPPTITPTPCPPSGCKR